MKNVLSLAMGVIIFSLLSCQKDEQEYVVKPQVVKTGTSEIEEAFPGKTGVTKKGFLLGEPIEYTDIDGQAVFQGDIILTPDQLTQTQLPIEDRNGRIEGAGRTDGRWPNNTVYYTIASTLTNQARVTDAIAHWQANSSIRFIQRTTQSNYITFRPGTGCSSNYGMIGGQQFINLASGCSTGSTIHEIGHALGVFHEQSRADRSNSIIIHWGNIEVGKEHNFKTYGQLGYSGFDHGPLDFGSIMMYSPYSFSKNGLPTITRLDGSTYTTQRTGLSTGDKSIIKVMYYLWKKYPGAAKDISVGADGSVYVIGSNATSGGYGIYRWNGVGWTQLSGGAVRIAVSPQGVPWVVNNVGKIFRRSGSGWQQLPGAAKDIGIGADGSVYVIGTGATSGGYGIYRWNGVGWTQLSGGAVRIAVSPQGVPWVVNNVGNIYRRSGSGWQLLPGAAKDIGIGANGAVYVIGTGATSGGYGIHQWNGKGWYKLTGGAVAVSVSPQGIPWVVNSIGNIFKGQ